MDLNKVSILKWLLLKKSNEEFIQFESLSHWKTVIKERFTEWESPIDRAIAFGFEADCVAYAFIAGFRAALQHLVPNLDHRLFISFCITEEGGNNPRAIKASLTPENDNSWILNGQKTFITGANEADQMLVAASVGVDDSGKNRIKLVKLDCDLRGIKIEQLPALSFIPEIAHGRVSFVNVPVSEGNILPGDGYLDYVKPFRIYEEIHVMAAILGYLTRIGLMYNWEKTVIEKIVALITLVKNLWKSDLLSEETHIVFAGFSHLLQQLIVETKKDWEKVPKDIRDSWERDQAILNIAHQARRRRLENAWASFV